MANKSATSKATETSPDTADPETIPATEARQGLEEQRWTKRKADLEDEWPALMSVAQAAAYTDRSKGTIMQAIRDDELFAARPGGDNSRKWLIPRSDLIAWVFDNS